MKEDMFYWQDSAMSFAGHRDRAEIPLAEEKIIEIPLGFQPYGVNSRPLPGGDAVLVADYFAPAVCAFELRVTERNLLFEKVTWIHGAQNGITRCRGGFPDIARPTGSNRCVSAFWGPADDGSVWIGRGDREFFVLTPDKGPMTAQEKSVGVHWVLSRRVLLPSDDAFPFVFSASFIGGSLHTIESNDRQDAYEWAQYLVVEQEFTAGQRARTYTRHGGTALSASHGPVTVANCEADREGIFYQDKKQILVPEICGTGICPLSNGGALVARYGQEAGGPFKGVPGVLLYVSPTLLAGVTWMR